MSTQQFLKIPLLLLTLALLACGNNDTNGGDDDDGNTVINRAPKQPMISDSNPFNELYRDDSRTLTATTEDPDGDDVTYTWTVMQDSADVSNDVLTGQDDNDSSRVTFTAPTAATALGNTYDITATASDGHGGTSDKSKAYSLTIVELKVVMSQPATSITKDVETTWSAESSSGVGLSYQWTLEQNPYKATALSDATNATLHYTPNKEGLYRLKLTVTDADKGRTAIAYHAFGIGTFNNDPSTVSGIISVDPSGLKAGQQQYLMVQAHDPNGDMLFTEWSLKPESCGTFADNGKYQDNLFALLNVPADASEDCTVSVSISDGYGGTAEATQSFTAPQQTIAGPTFAYDTDRRFTLPYKTASFTLPARYYDDNDTVKTAHSLQLPDDWTCTGNACDNQQINFADTEQTITISKDDDITITFKLLASNNEATAILNRADLERIDASDENRAATYYQLATIDLEAKLHKAANSEDSDKHWTPIGVYRGSTASDNHSFSGSYDGQSLPIRNLRIQDTEKSNIGLFAYTESSNNNTIQNIALQGVDILGNNQVGGLVGFNNGSIKNSYARGFVYGSQWVGGLVGQNSGNISNSYASGKVAGHNDVGGLVGNNFVGDITRSYARGTVFGGNEEVGGLVGANYGTISSSYASGSVSGKENVGGLLGHNAASRDNSGSISNSYASGKVAGKENVGGLLGKNSGSSSGSYWDTTTGPSTSDSGEGKSSTDMQMQTTYVGWDFGSIWGIDGAISNGYPYLLCVGGQVGYQHHSDAYCKKLSISIADGQAADLYPDSTRTLQAAALPNANYQWLVMQDGKDVSDTVLAVDENDLSRATFTAPANGAALGEYRITVTATDPSGRTSSANFVLNIVELKAVITAPTTSITKDVEATWSAESSSGVGLSYQWTLEQNPYKATALSDATNAMLHYTPNKEGLYRLKLTVTDADKGRTAIAYHAFGIGTFNNDPPTVSGIISVDPSGLKAGQQQYLMVQGHDPNGDMLFTEWSLKPESCGTFADNGKYQDNLFALLNVPADASEDCTVSVSISDGYGGTAEATQSFTAPQQTIAGPTFAYDTDRRFTLPYKTASFTLPARYYDDNDTVKTAHSLQLPDDWTCTGNACDNQQINFADTEQTITISKDDDITITFKLLASNNEATAILNRADLERIDASDENRAATYYQLATIDLEAKLHKAANSEDSDKHWTPIGVYRGSTASDNHSFSGSYDGQSLPIRNLRIQDTEKSNIGLFAYTESSNNNTIQNIALQGVDILGNDQVGGLVGFNNGSIKNSYARGFVYGSQWVGGLVGQNSGNISNSYASGKVAGHNDVGGLVGNNFVGDITRSYARGTVFGGNEEVGGLVGANYGTISSSYASGSVSGNENVGGLLGHNAASRDNSGSISNSYASGKVAGKENVGGLLGKNSGSSSGSYWDTTTGPSTSDSGEGKSSTDMQMQTTYVGWDFGSIWGIDGAISNGYPYLLCVGGQVGYQHHSDAYCKKLSISIADGQAADLYPDSTRTLQAAALPNANYQWLVMQDGKDVSDTVLAVDENDLSRATFTAPANGAALGEYRITVTATDPSGRTSSANFVLNIVELKAVITAPTTSITKDVEATWSAESSSGVGLSYQWTLEQNPYKATALSDATNATLHYTPNKEGLYRLKLTVTDADKGRTAIAYHAFGIGTFNNDPPTVSGIISVDPSGLKAGQQQYLMVQAHDPNGDMLFTEWSLKPESCGTFADNGKYQDNLFALLNVPADASEDCTVSVSISDGYGGTAEATQSFTAPQQTIAGPTFAYDTDRRFTLPYKTASFTLPARYYDDNDTVKTAHSLQLPDDWTCTGNACDNQQINFADTEQTITISKDDDITITFKLLASNNEATAILNRADLERIDASDENRAATYYQLATIDLEAKLHKAANSEDSDKHWTPIGVYRGSTASDNHSFSGSYDGQSLPIRNLRIQDTEKSNIGLFAYTESSNNNTIQNIALQGVDILGNDQVGGLVGFNNGSIKNSYARGKVSGTGETIYTGETIGGLVGHNNGNISNSYASGFVYGSQWVGGLVGQNSGNISNSYASGKVAGTGNDVGGLVGINFVGDITRSYASGKVAGNENVGGLVGANYGTISSSYASGSVSGKENVGGLLGHNAASRDNSGSISNSYASGKVAGKENVGGLLGKNSGSSSGSYWDTTTGPSTSDSGEGKSSTDMQMQTTYVGWDFGSIWGIDGAISNGYPYLLCVGGQVGYQHHSDAYCKKLSISIADGQAADLYPDSTRTLQAAALPNANYQWLVMQDGKDVSDTVLAVDENDLSRATFTAPANGAALGEYRITVTATDPSGRTSSANFVLNIVELKAVITAPTTSITKDVEATWSAESSSGVGLSYQWTLEQNPYKATALSDATNATLHYTPNKEGLYRLKLTVTDADKGRTAIAYHAFGIGTFNNDPPTVSGIISVDPSGLKAGQQQYLMVQAHDPNGDMLFTEWSLKPESCGTFADNGKYQDNLFALLNVPADASEDCTVSVSISDGYGGTAEATQSFTAPQQTIAGPTFAYDTDRRFTLPYKTASFTLPARYYDDNDTVKTAHSLQLPDDWTCTGNACDNQQINFADTEQTITISKDDDITITFKLLASNNEATAILNRADLERIDASDENRAATYYQLATIDLEAKLHKAANSEDSDKHWTPIGVYRGSTASDNHSFSGSYDGQSLPIRNLRIQDTEKSNIGLFAYTESSNNNTIQNIALQGLDVRGNDFVGGLVGFNNGSIKNSYARGKVSGTEETIYTGETIGGLVGHNNGNISNSYASGFVYGSQWVGGLVGQNSGNISNSYASGKVAGTGNDVGGLVGINFVGDITRSYASGKVAGNENVGGLVGANYGTISSSYASGSVSGKENVGGLLGHNAASRDNSGSISNSYASGKVAGKENVGGLLGKNSGSSSGSYWDTTTGPSTSDSGEGKSSTDMQMQTTYVGWDFGSIWGIDGAISNGYPYLLCVGGQVGYSFQGSDCTAAE